MTAAESARTGIGGDLFRWGHRAELRYACETLPSGGPSWPWLTLLVNVSGCLVIGVLMTVILDLTAPHRLLRPFLGVGVLGGYTTFSTYTVDVQEMLVDERYVGALIYLTVTPVAALVAVWLGSSVTRVVVGRARRKEHDHASRWEGTSADDHR